MNQGFTILLLVIGLGSFVAAYPLSPVVSYLQDETQAETDLKAIMNTLLQGVGNEQAYSMPIKSPDWFAASVKIQKFSDLLKKVGRAFCGAAYNPSSLAEAVAQLDQMDEVEIEGFKSFLKRFGSNLCDYITNGNGGANEQALISFSPDTWIRHQPKQSVAELQGFLRKIGRALCKAAYDGSDLSALAEAMPSWQKMDEADIESVKDFFKRFGSNLCNYVTDSNGKTGSSQDLTSLVQRNAEAQGFFRKIADALCRAGYGDKNPTATAELLGLSDKADVQKFKDFLKRFGSNLCDYVTNNNGGESSVNKQSWTPAGGWATTDQDKRADVEGLRSVARKIGSALCRALDGNPSAVAESFASWEKMDEVEAQSFKDMLKTFGSRICDYITKGNGKMDTTNNELAQELIAVME